MKTKLISILAISIAIAGCSTMEQSIGLGVGIGGAVGAGMGTAAGNNFRSAMLGLGVGALFGGAMGYLSHRDREERERQLKASFKKEDGSKTPSLTAPEVRRIWVPDKVEGSKFIDGHFEFFIEKNSVWSR